MSVPPPPPPMAGPPPGRPSPPVKLVLAKGMKSGASVTSSGNASKAMAEEEKTGPGKFTMVKFDQASADDFLVAVGQGGQQYYGNLSNGVHYKWSDFRAYFERAWKRAYKQALVWHTMDLGRQRLTILMDHGMNPNFQWGHHDTALGMACATTALQTAPSSMDEEAKALFVQGKEKPNVHMCQLLLDRGANLNGYPADYAVTWPFEKLPLVLACGSGNVEVARFLIQQGADVTNKDAKGNTILFYSMSALFMIDAETGLDLIKLLILAGCDPEAANSDGQKVVEVFTRAYMEVLESSEEDSVAEMHRKRTQTTLKAVIDWLETEGKQLSKNQKTKTKTKTAISSSTEKRLNVMLSYNWDHQSLALQLKGKMERDGIEVWMDVEKMRGSMLESMANAIEGCSVFVMLVTPQYFKSGNCRLEAEYAVRERKVIIPVMASDYRPQGWLGFIMGSKLYYNLQEDSMTAAELQKSFDSITKAVNSYLSPSPDTIASNSASAVPGITETPSNSAGIKPLALAHSASGSADQSSQLDQLLHHMVDFQRQMMSEHEKTRQELALARQEITELRKEVQNLQTVKKVELV